MEVTIEITQTEYNADGTDVDDRIGVEVHEMCSSGRGNSSSWLQLSFIDHTEIADVTIKLKDGCLLFTQEGTAEVLLANLWK